jgi:hypothetical protein
MTSLSSNTPSLGGLRPVAFEDLVRVGRANDGGYVLPRSAIIRSRALLSLGVNDDWSFEEGVLEINPAVSITCVDGTTSMRRVIGKAARKSVDMVGHLFSLQLEKFMRNARYLSRPLEFRRFFARHVLLKLMVAGREAPGTVTLATLLRCASVGGAPLPLILKVDIEGAEFDVLPPSMELLSPVTALIVEFHGLGRNWPRFVTCVNELKNTFHLAHVHGNNFQGYIAGTEVPEAMEVTFVNRTLLSGQPSPSSGDYPVPGLDMPNNWQRADLKLNFDR